MKKLRELLYDSEPFEFVFDVPIEDAVKRLHSNVSRSSFPRLTSQGMVGRVSRDSVKIQRAIPMVANSFTPLLDGSFSKEGDKTKLSGVFRFHRFVRFFMTLWFGFLTLWLLVSSAAVLAKPSEAWYFPLFGILMFYSGIVIIKFGKWFSRNDKVWLKERITNAIESNS